MPINNLNTKGDLEKVFKEYNVQIFRFVLVRCNMQKEIAEELTQDVFINAWVKHEQFNPNKSSLKNWLYVIARNKVIDHYRKNKPTVSLSLFEEEISETTATIEDSETSLQVSDVLKKLDLLSQSEKEVLILRYIQELELAEIAQIINKHYSATKVMVFRALQKLRCLCK